MVVERVISRTMVTAMVVTTIKMGLLTIIYPMEMDPQITIQIPKTTIVILTTWGLILGFQSIFQRRAEIS